MRLDSASKRLVAMALREDLGKHGDLTTRFFLPAGKAFRARIQAKAAGVFCGRAAAEEVFRLAAPRAALRWRKRDGDALRPGETIVEIRGGREILTAERPALNFLQRLSGVATATAAYARALRGTRTRVYDTRKTLPGWRTLDKYAVRCGGGANHRMGLHDMILLKDNHLAGWTAEGAPARALRARVAAFRRRHPRVPIEIEAKTRAEVERALDLGADIILLDNMPPARLKREIALIRARAPRAGIEISGRVNLKTLPALARLGADRISVGRITHSAPALDMSLELDA
ncbi:MAG TPA: carboxylating nicotinate-nucleotide diphosphorylase [Elusimicrobiota bacterium]|jgi:nicotinate-nucleotide pyrophosphorylase (carboxylating)|nr:carboxylating nicotinate-nucleotide diphosphorylase [Elusimicrobiota bacterium]